MSRDLIDALRQSWNNRVDEDQDLETFVLDFLELPEWKGHHGGEGKQALNVYVNKEGEFYANFAYCPLALAGRPKPYKTDFWVYQGQVYYQDDVGLCQFCQNQLACAVGGDDGPISDFAEFKAIGGPQ